MNCPQSDVLGQSASSTGCAQCLGCPRRSHAWPSVPLSGAALLPTWMPVAHEASGGWLLVKHPGYGHPFQPFLQFRTVEHLRFLNGDSFPLLLVPKLCMPLNEMWRTAGLLHCGTEATMKTVLPPRRFVRFCSRGSEPVMTGAKKPCSFSTYILFPFSAHHQYQ